MHNSRYTSEVTNIRNVQLNRVGDIYRYTYWQIRVYLSVHLAAIASIATVVELTVQIYVSVLWACWDWALQAHNWQPDLGDALQGYPYRFGHGGDTWGDRGLMGGDWRVIRDKIWRHCK